MMITRRTGLAALAASAVSIGLSACGGSQTSSASGGASSGGKYSIGVLIKDTTIPFFGRQIQGYKDAAAKYGMDVQIYNGKSSNSTQVANIQQMVTKGDNMIIVTPGDSRAIDGALLQAKQANIPVVAVNTAPSDKSNLLSFVGQDDIVYGKSLGELLVQATGGQGNVAIVRGTLGDPPDTLRRQGLDTVLSANPNLKVVAEQSANWDSAKALAVTQDFLSKFPTGQLDAIVDVGPEVAGGAEYAHKNGRSEVNFIIGDFPTNVKAGIEAGYIYGAVNQDPYEQSAKAMELAKKYLDGDKNAFPATVYLDLPLVTKENVSQYQAAW